MLVNKLATAVLIKADKQYSCQIRKINLETKNLIQVLSLQVIIWSKIRLIANNLELYRKTSNFDQKIMFSSIFINFEIVFSDIFAEKKSILNLIKDIQEFDLLCKWISSQFHRKLKKNSLFALIENEILKKINYVFMFQQKIIWVQLLKLFHDCFNNDH